MLVGMILNILLWLDTLFQSYLNNISRRTRAHCQDALSFGWSLLLLLRLSSAPVGPAVSDRLARDPDDS